MTGSNTWDHVTVEGDLKPPSLQEHTALTYKVTGICRSGRNERRIRKQSRKRCLGKGIETLYSTNLQKYFIEMVLGTSCPALLRIVCGFFNVPQRKYEHGRYL